MASAVTPPVSPSLVGAEGLERRVIALDGVRGLATAIVLLSHYFAEVSHGVRPLMMGWIAVDMFFVLSGYLIGRLILERQGHANFFLVFYVRRFCRIVPAYLITVLGLWALLRVAPAAWADQDVQLPLWSYLTFTQNFVMAAKDSIGAHWLSPTWTLALEEQFYLVIPALVVFTPRRRLPLVLIGAIAVALALRAYVYLLGGGNVIAAAALLPGRADVLACGVLAALAMKTEGIDWRRYDQLLRVTPLVAVIAALGIRLVSEPVFGVLSPLLMGVACAAFLLAIVRGAPEAQRFRGRFLRFLGDNGYCIYLTHLPLLGLAHGLVFGTTPGLASAGQWALTIALVPVSLFIGWGFTRLVEEPLTRYGRKWRWSATMRGRQPMVRKAAA